MLLTFTIEAQVEAFNYIPITSSRITRESVTPEFLENLYKLANKHFCDEKGIIAKDYFIERVKTCLENKNHFITFDEPHATLTVCIEYIDDITAFKDVVWTPVVFPKG